ncbi:MAG: zf-HC2 domain-containing protein [Chlorobi bacterium]|nr:zf-HC2 domain-containing protein [Chlorobiota bacterium]
METVNNACLKFRRLLEDALDGNLSPEEYKSFIKHATFCPACHRKLRGEIMFRKLLQRALNQKQQELFHDKAQQLIISIKQRIYHQR